MFQRVAVAAVLVLISCTPTSSSLQVADAVQFPGVAVGESTSSTLALTNTGTTPLQLTFATNGSEFTAASTTTHLEPAQSTALALTFTPAALGAREGTLSITGADQRITVALRGAGKGGQLEVPETILLSTALITPGVSNAEAKGTLTLRNTGVPGWPVTVKSITAEPPTLCIGPECTGIRDLMVQERPVAIPLSAALSLAGTAEWTLTVTSNDPLTPTRTVLVRAVAEQLDVCQFDAPATVTLTTPTKDLFLHHAGSLRCQVNEVTFISEGGAVVELDTLPLPSLADANTPFHIGLRTMLGGTRPLGTLRITLAGAPAIEIAVRSEQTGFVTVTPSADFGAVGALCVGAQRAIDVYNTTASALIIDSVEVATSNQEFFLNQAIRFPVTLEPGDAPLTLFVNYVPNDVGPDTSALLITTREQGTFVVGLSGLGTQRDPSVEGFQLPAAPKADLFMVIDTSPSFAARRTEVRQRVRFLLDLVTRNCLDTRVAFAPAEAAVGATVDFSRSDAGEAWAASTGVDFVNNALSAFDALPTSSETEGCIGPASQLLPGSATRPDARVSGVCITDALEQSSTPLAKLTALRQLFPNFSWSVASGVAESACAIEAIDDGVHQQLVLASSGVQLDVCQPDSWFNQRVSETLCVSGRDFSLNGKPQDGVLTVSRNGTALPTGWQLIGSSVRFDPGVLQPGDALEFSYVPSCD